MATIEEILIKLHQLSDEGKITWETTADASTFSAVIGNSSALISKEGSTINLTLLNSYGENLDHMYSEDWENTRMQQLYESARREALNVDAELDNVLVELNQL